MKYDGCHAGQIQYLPIMFIVYTSGGNCNLNFEVYDGGKKREDEYILFTSPSRFTIPHIMFLQNPHLDSILTIYSTSKIRLY